MKKSLFFAALFAASSLLLFSPLHAQRFEWAKGYSSQESGNYIKGSVTDSEGNLYILGSFRNDAAWNGEFLLLPMAPYGYACNNVNTIIAKISPEGEMLWRKVLHSNNGQVNYPQDIKKVGDSAFACMMVMALPCEGNYTYYLDTLIPDVSDYPISSRYMGYALCNAFVVFDFEGNVKEQHFLQITYTDYNGDDIVYHVTHPFDPIPWYLNTYFKWEQVSFDIDGEGNIYISRCADDWTAHGEERFDVQNGTIRGIKFWVDRRLAGYYHITGDNPMKWYPQIVKFAPHFDTLLACRYVIQGMSDSMEYHVYNTTTKVDNNGNVYHMSEISADGFYDGDYLDNSGYHSNTLYIDSARGLSFSHCDRCNYRSFLVQFDNNLEPNWIVTLDDSVINEITSLSRLYFHDIYFDHDSNLLFVSASTGRGVFSDTVHSYSVLTYNGTPLNLKNNNAFVMAFRMDTITPALMSYGAIPSRVASDGLSKSRGNLVAKNNRIFLQHRFVGGVRYPNQNIRFSSWYRDCMGLAIFDYGGNLIRGNHYATSSPDSRPGSISLQDSVLYLCNLLVGDVAIFGDIHVPAQGKNACIAKYVDTAFMTPYVRPNPTGIIPLEDGNISVFPNPANSLLYVATDGIITSATATAMSGVRIPLSASGSTVDIACLNPGIYIIEITTDNKTFNHKIIKK